MASLFIRLVNSLKKTEKKLAEDEAIRSRSAAMMSLAEGGVGGGSGALQQKSLTRMSLKSSTRMSLNSMSWINSPMHELNEEGNENHEAGEEKPQATFYAIVALSVALISNRICGVLKFIYCRPTVTVRLR